MRSRNLVLLLAAASAGCSEPPAEPETGGEPPAQSGGAGGSAPSGTGGGGVPDGSSTVATDTGPADGENDAAAALPVLRVQGKDFSDAQGNVIALRGFGLGGWIVPEGYMIGSPAGEVQPTAIKKAIRNKVGASRGDQVILEYTNDYVTKTDLAAIRGWGFNTLRVTFNANDLLPPAGQPAAAPYTYDEGGFHPLDDIASWGAELGLYLVLDMHCAPGAQSTDNPADANVYAGGGQLWAQPDVYWPRTIDVWLKLAQRYRGNPWVVGYDLINEPMLPGTKAPGSSDSNGPWSGHDNTPLRNLYAQITSALRAAGDRKIVFAEAGFWGMNFKDLTPPWDDNMVYSFHFYPPPTDQGFFTGADTTGPSFAPVFALDVPIWLGETGERSAAVAAQMVQFLATANRGHSIGWSWWTDKKMNIATEPWQCSIPAEYNALNANWNGTAQDTAFDALMKWAGALKTETCTLQTDLVRALGGTL